MKPMPIVILLMFCCACVSRQIPEVRECQGISPEGRLSLDSEGYPVVSHDLFAYYPECVNALAREYGLDRVRAGTFDERRKMFGPEWEEGFRREACVNRSWATRLPSICLNESEDDEDLDSAIAIS